MYNREDVMEEARQAFFVLLHIATNKIDTQINLKMDSEVAVLYLEAMIKTSTREVQNVYKHQVSLDYTSEADYQQEYSEYLSSIRDEAMEPMQDDFDD